jgi:hypothetical protein
VGALLEYPLLHLLHILQGDLVQDLVLRLFTVAHQDVRDLFSEEVVADLVFLVEFTLLVSVPLHEVLLR